MHPTLVLLVAQLAQQATALPSDRRAHILLPSSVPDDTILPFFQTLSLTKRRVPPPQCADDASTEKQGCFTLLDGLKTKVRFALAPGQSLDKGQGLGAGTYGSVAKCVLKDGQDIAVKQYREGFMGAERSFKLLKALEGNRYIVKAIAHGKIYGRSALAMELAADGSLEMRMNMADCRGKGNENAMKTVAKQLLDGYTYMHSKGIAHLDIHPGNIAFQGDTPKMIDLDFGCTDQECLEWHPRGDNGREGPEAIGAKNNPKIIRLIDPLKNDVWTLGRMFIEMTTGVAPPTANSAAMRVIWEDNDPKERVKRIKKVWPSFSDIYAELLSDILCRQEQRIKMAYFKDRFQDIKIYS